MNARVRDSIQTVKTLNHDKVNLVIRLLSGLHFDLCGFRHIMFILK